MKITLLLTYIYIYNIYILVCLYSAFLLVHRTQGALHNITPADLYIPEPSQLPGKHTRCLSLLGEHTQHSTISITVYSRVPILNTPGWSEETRSKVRFPSVHKATKRRVEPTTLRSRVQRATTRPLLSFMKTTYHYTHNISLIATASVGISTQSPVTTMRTLIPSKHWAFSFRYISLENSLVLIISSNASQMNGRSVTCYERNLVQKWSPAIR